MMCVSPDSELACGRRLEMHRRQRRLSRRVVANLVGRSEEWLRLVESGQRKLDSIEILARLVDVLHVDDPAEIINWPRLNFATSNCEHDDVLNAVRKTIADHPALCVYNTPRSDDHDISLLATMVQECRQVWASSDMRYLRLADALPHLLWEARTARLQRQDLQTAELLIDAYHLARNLLAACGDHIMAGTVADRSVCTSEQAYQPLLVAASAWHVATTMLDANKVGESHDYAMSAVRHVVNLMPLTAEAQVLCGALRLVAAHAAAVMGDRRKCSSLLSIARHEADDLGDDRQVRGIPFGPVEVEIASVEIALALNDPGRVLRLASTINPSEQQSLDRRLKYYLCEANAFILLRDDASATLALMQMSAVAPTEMRYNPKVQECIRHLTRRGNYLVRSEVGYLAELAGIVR